MHSPYNKLPSSTTDQLCSSSPQLDPHAHRTCLNIFLILLSPALFKELATYQSQWKPKGTLQPVPTERADSPLSTFPFCTAAPRFSSQLIFLLTKLSSLWKTQPDTKEQMRDSSPRGMPRGLMQTAVRCTSRRWHHFVIKQGLLLETFT